MGVGAKIREVRKAQKLTQIEVSARAQIAVNSLRLYEAEKRQPHIEQIRRIADALNCSVEYLLGFGVSPKKSYWTDKFRKGLSAALTSIEAADIEATGFDIDFANAIASGEKGFSFEDACQICNELGVSVDEILHLGDED